MKDYRICFTNTHEFIVHGLNRNDAIKRGVIQTHGLLTKTRQRKNLRYCKLA